MIKVEGYKAFHGDMKITPKNTLYPAFYICDKDWLYRMIPLQNVEKEYGGDHIYLYTFNLVGDPIESYPAEICEPIEEN